MKTYGHLRQDHSSSSKGYFPIADPGLGAAVCLPAVRIQFAAFYSVGCSFRIFVSFTLFTGRQSACTLMLELQYASEALSGKVTEARMRQPRNGGKYSSKSLVRSATTT